jgi:hypothetical protein
MIPSLTNNIGDELALTIVVNEIIVSPKFTLSRQKG